MFINLQKSSIFNEEWPIVEKIDYQKIKASNYLVETAHSFRTALKSHQMHTKRSEKPTNATIWVAETFPEWQRIILSKLKQLYISNGKSELPDNKEIVQILSKEEKLTKFMKRDTMPFVQTIREKFPVKGTDVFFETSEYDEIALLEENIEYFKQTLNVSLSLILNFTKYLINVDKIFGGRNLLNPVFLNR